MEWQFTPAQLAWLEALESDNYKQGVSFLTTRDKKGNDKDCCLGVGCKVAVEMGLNIQVEARKEYSWREKKRVFQIFYDYEEAELPDRVRDFLGLKTGAGKALGSNLLPINIAKDRIADADMYASTLTELNDSRAVRHSRSRYGRWTFKRIATLLREHPDWFFEAPDVTETSSEV